MKDSTRDAMLVVSLFLTISAGSAASAIAGERCDNLFSQYGLKAFTSPDAALVAPKSLVEQRIFDDEDCREASFFLDIDEALSAAPPASAEDVSGTWINDNIYYSTSGLVTAGIEILEIEIDDKEIIFHQDAIGNASYYTDQHAAVYPAHVSKQVFETRDDWVLFRNSSGQMEEYFADPISSERADDFLWKSLLDYWPSEHARNSVRLEVSPSGKLVLWHPVSSALLPDGPQRMLVATYTRASREDIDLSYHFVSAGDLSTGYFPCILRKVQSKFSDADVSWERLRDAALETDAFKEQLFEINAERRSAPRGSERAASANQKLTDYIGRMSEFRSSQRFLLMTSLAKNAYGCPSAF